MMKKFKISDDRQLNKVIQGYPLSTNEAVVSEYKRNLKKLIKAMRDDFESSIFKALSSNAFNEFIEDQESLEDSQRVVFDEISVTSKFKKILDRLNKKWSDIFKRKGSDYIGRMIKKTDDTNRKSVNISFKRLSGGLNIKSAISNTGISETKKMSKNQNLSLLESIYVGYYTNISGEVMRGISSGLITSLKKNIIKRGGTTERRAGTVATNEVKRLYNALNKQRMQSQGLNKFIWRHSSGGQFPRKLHMSMDGNVYSFDDLPVIDEKTGERGIPGQAINCRCFMVPVIEFKD